MQSGAINNGLRALAHPTMSAVAIPIRIVLSRVSESEASGSGLVTPVQPRRRPSHGFPAHHPHRSRRKVSAPPELQPHLCGQHASSAHSKQGGANPETAVHAAPTEYIINFTPAQTITCEGVYSGSDSGVPSEYSSWALPIGSQRPDTASPDDDLASPAGSLDDLIDPRLGSGRSEAVIYASDSECESEGLSPPVHRRSSSGMNNPAYVNTEMRPVGLSVGIPPPLSRSHTDTALNTPSPSRTPNSSGRQRTNSMVLQLNLNNRGLANNSPSGLLGNARSVSMVSLHNVGASNATTVQATSAYPNMASFVTDTQSLYSEVTAPSHSVGYKVIDDQVAGGSSTQISAAAPDHVAEEEPKPTEPEKKKEWSIHTLNENLSTMYAIFIFMLAIVIYMADTFSGHDSAMAEGFNVFLIVVQLLWLAYVHIDVRRYLQLISTTLKETKGKQGDKDQLQLEPSGDGQYQIRINLPEPRKTIPQHYGFTSGRHGGSLYLKIGATVFCFGHLIHSGLNLGQKILYLTDDSAESDNCTCTSDVVMSVLQPIYAFYQLFFIFKYSNLIINRRKLLTRFALMHCISASLCFWFYTILQETLQAIFTKGGNDFECSDPTNTSAYGSTKSYGHSYKFSDDDDSDEMFDDDDDDEKIFKLSTGISGYSSSWSISYGCEKSTDLTQMINYTTPYLYPFSIEYSILIVGVWILLWENIGRIDLHTHIPSIEVTYEGDDRKAFTSNLIIYVDCHSSNRGLFAGLLMTVATVISIILFFIFTSSEENLALGQYVNGFSELLLLTIMGIAAALAFASVRHLDVITKSISNVDKILLFICLPCIFLYAFFSMMPAITSGDVLFLSVSLVQVTQVVIQTALICDGLQRCSNSSALQQKKLGREVVTFLVVANVAMWLLETFEIKREEGNLYKYCYYGKELWTLLSHLTLPLALFYRFHSSVCLSDMWKAAYEPEELH